MKRVVRLDTSVCFRITQLMNNQIKSRKRATSKKIRESDDENAVAIVKSVSQLGCVSQDSDALVCQGRKSRETRCRKSWNQFKGYDSHSLRYVMGVSRKKKGPSLGKINVKVPHQRSPYAVKFEDRSHEETERQQRCARSKAWNPAKNTNKLKEKDKAAFYFSAEGWVLPAASTKESEEREFAVDSGASMHMVSKNNLNSAELETIRTSRSPTTVVTANDEVQTREEATVFVKQLDLFVKDMLLEETPAVLSLVKLCEDHGYTYHCISNQKPHLIRNGKRIDCKIANYVPFVVLGLSASSSLTTPSPTSPSSSSQDSVFDVNRHTKNPVPERSGSMSEELRGDPLHGTTEIENKNKKKSQKKYKEIYRMNCLIGYRNSWRIWLMKVLLQSFGETHTKEVQTLPSHLMNFQWSREQKVEPGLSMHSEHTHFPNDPNCGICLKTKINKGFLQKTCLYCRAQSGKFWWFDHWRSQSSKWRKWIAEQSSICNRGGARLGNPVVTVPAVQNKTFPGDPEEPNEVVGASKETQSHLHWQFLGIWQSLWRAFLESLYVGTAQIGNKWDCWKSSAQSKRRHVCRIVAIRCGWKLVGGFYGMLLLFAKYSG